MTNQDENDDLRDALPGEPFTVSSKPCVSCGQRVAYRKPFVGEDVPTDVEKDAAEWLEALRRGDVS